ncbi:MAG: MFS transporter [Firmicutes bacterium]|nr:MFS transporter [Bacillota bacterium]
MAARSALATNFEPDVVKIDRNSTLKTLKETLYYLSFPFGFLAFSLPIYGEKVGATPFQIGLLFSAFSMMTLVVRPILGNLLDKVGRRPFFIGGVAAYALTDFIFALLQSYPGLVMARVVQGIAFAFLWLTVYAIISDLSLDGERGLNYGKVIEAQNRGQINGAIVGFILIWGLESRFLLGFRIAFLIYFVFGAYAFWQGWRIDETLGADCGKPVASREKAAGQISRDYFKLLLVTFLTSISYGMLAPIVIIFLRQRISGNLIMLAASYVPAAVVWSFLPSRFGRLSDRFGRKRFVVAGLVAGAVVVALIPRAGSFWFLTGLWVLAAAALTMALPIQQAMVSDLTGDDVRGRAYGYYALANDAGNVVGPAVGTWLYGRGQAYPFYLNGFVLLLAGLVVLFFSRGNGRQTGKAGYYPGSGEYISKRG